MNFNVFDPNQWVNVTGFAVLPAVCALTLLGVLGKLAGGARWADWLDDTHGRGSIADPWGDGRRPRP